LCTSSLIPLILGRACEPEYPVEAIYPEDEVPEEKGTYITKAADSCE
jgi:hypothetical protein